MAQKIRIDNIEKQKNTKKINTINKVSTFNSLLKTRISLFLNIILIITIIILFIWSRNEIYTFQVKLNDSQKNTEILEQENASLKYDSTQLNNILTGKTTFYIINKLDFLDENIVFKLDGFGNYYYTYDCMMNITIGSSFSYVAYNINNAIQIGLQRGNC